MQVMRLRKCGDFAFSGLRGGVRRFVKMAKDRSGTAIIEYAFLAGLVAVASAVGFDLLGTAVGNMYDVIATAFVASMPTTP